MKDKKVLIVGNSYSLAKYFAGLVKEVFVLPGDASFSDFAKSIDIREDNTPEILDFVLENDIDLTIVVSEMAVKSDIASAFQQQNKSIFAPCAKSADIAISKSQGKRFLYKMHAPTPKFGFFDKLPNAIEYLKNADYPVVISSDENYNGRDRMCCTVFEHAKCFAEDLFACGVPKIVIEEYAYGRYFSLYAVTDGYHVLPVTTCQNFMFSENGDGGLFTSGVGCYCPDSVVPNEVKSEIFDKVIVPAISKLEEKGISYTGILGVNAVYKGNNEYTILGFSPFFSEFNMNAILNNVDENLFELFDSCANGFFADEYEDILINDNVSVSCLVKSHIPEKKIESTDLLESDLSLIGAKRIDGCLYSVKGDNFVLTSCAKTLSRAKEKLMEDVEMIAFDGMKLRKDIFC